MIELNKGNSLLKLGDWNGNERVRELKIDVSKITILVHLQQLKVISNNNSMFKCSVFLFILIQVSPFYIILNYVVIKKIAPTHSILASN